MMAHPGDDMTSARTCQLLNIEDRNVNDKKNKKKKGDSLFPCNMKFVREE